MDINLTAPICATSYGMVALNLTKELTEQGHKVSIFPVGNLDGQEIPPHFHDSLRASLNNAKFFNPSAPSVRLWHQFDLAQHVGRGKRIGWPIFELNKFNDLELHHLRAQDQLIVCSRWAFDVCYNNYINRPTYIVPLGVDTSIFSPAQSKQSREIFVPNLFAGCSFQPHYIKRVLDDNATVFINIGKKELRKGHDIILECFEAAFTSEDNVKLLMVWGNRILDNMYPSESKAWTDMYTNSRLKDKIYLYEWLPSQNDVVQLIKNADCGIFPSRAEGWNLDLLEVMACGLPVITTDYSAHTEFVNSENAQLICGDELEPAYDGVWFMGQGNWLQITRDMKNTIIDKMRHIHQIKQSGENLFNEAGVQAAKKFSWENSAKNLVEII